MGVRTAPPGAFLPQMESTTVIRAARMGATAVAGVFGVPAPPDVSAEAALDAALRAEGPQVAIRREGALALGAAGWPGAQLELVNGCVCAIEGSLVELDRLAIDLGLHPAASPAQVVAAAYRSYGSGALARLRGSFALVLWDRAAARGLIARDQLGGRAIFLRGNGHRLAFATELRNLLRLLPARPGPDPAAVVHWLALGGPPGDRTFYEGVTQLPAGHCIELDSAGWRTVRYWSPVYRRPEAVSREEAAARVRSALERSVLRCSSGPDEVTGVMLSGGIDSAAVAGVATACGRAPLAYSAVFPRHPQIDESKLVALLSSSLGLRSLALPVLSGSVLRGALDYTREWEVPASSPNLFFWNTLLGQAANDGVSVLLDGEGGDALFWLSPFLLADRLLRGRVLSAISLARRFPGAQGPVPVSMVVKLLRDWGVRGALTYRTHRLRQRLRGSAAFAPRWFSDSSVRLRFDTDTELAWKRAGAPRWWSGLLDSVAGRGSSLIHDATRRRSASVGLEARHPLLDVDLIELVLSLPPELAFDPAVSRPLLRESVRGLIPDEVRLRPTKSSFDALFHEALAGRDLPSARSLLLARDAEVNAFVDRERMRTELFTAGPPETFGARQSWALDVWRLLTTEIWLRAQAGRPVEAIHEVDSTFFRPRKRVT